MGVGIGQRFGRWVVFSVPHNALTTSKAVVKCDCGNKKSVTINNLLRGRSKSCGCWQREEARSRRTINLMGRSFGRLTVVGETKKPAKSNGGVLWLCGCACGAEGLYASGNLLWGTTQSCGCLQRERARKGCKPGDAAKHYVLDRYRRDAKRKKRTWELTDDMFYQLVSSPCHYCGLLPPVCPKDNDKVFRMNGIDRKDNDGGYVVGNVLPCCTFCQYSKRDLKYEIFIENIKRLSEYGLWNR